MEKQVFISARHLGALAGVALALGCAWVQAEEGGIGEEVPLAPFPSEVPVPAIDEFTTESQPGESVMLATRYLAETDMPLQAAARILTAVQQGFIEVEEAAASQQIIQQYERLGPYERARYLSDVFGTHWTAVEYNEFWLQRASALLQREAFADAQRAVQELRAPYDPAMAQRRQSLLGLALLLQSRFAEANAALESRQGFPRTHLSDHFNFAMSMIGQGRKAEGVALLDELAEIPADNDSDRAVRDRANMVLGWNWLKSKQGASARPPFKRVSLTGPYSNMALLGLGWAELIPNGNPQKVKFKRRLSCADLKNPPANIDLSLYQSYLICIPSDKTFEFDFTRRLAYQPGKRGKARFNDALRPLLVLSQRGMHDPAVQEALLAIGYTYRQLDQRAEAINAYKQAVKSFEAEIARLGALESAIQQDNSDPNRILESQGPADQFSDLRSSRSYARLVADLESIRQCMQMHQETADWIAKQAPSTERRIRQVDYVREQWARHDATITAAQSSLTAEFRTLVLNDLAQRRTRLREYLSDALLAIAQQYDR